MRYIYAPYEPGGVRADQSQAKYMSRMFPPPAAAAQTARNHLAISHNALELPSPGFCLVSRLHVCSCVPNKRVLCGSDIGAFGGGSSARHLCKYILWSQAKCACATMPANRKPQWHTQIAFVHIWDKRLMQRVIAKPRWRAVIFGYRKAIVSTKHYWHTLPPIEQVICVRNVSASAGVENSMCPPFICADWQEATEEATGRGYTKL